MGRNKRNLGRGEIPVSHTRFTFLSKAKSSRLHFLRIRVEKRKGWETWITLCRKGGGPGSARGVSLKGPGSFLALVTQYSIFSKSFMGKLNGF